MSKRIAKLSEASKQALEIIKNADGWMTFAQVKETLPNLNPAHLGALTRRGLVKSEPKEVEEWVLVKKKVNVYTFVKDIENGKEGE
jgi:hypothetical protein